MKKYSHMLRVKLNQETPRRVKYKVFDKVSLQIREQQSRSLSYLTLTGMTATLLLLVVNINRFSEVPFNAELVASEQLLENLELLTENDIDYSELTDEEWSVLLDDLDETV